MDKLLDESIPIFLRDFNNVFYESIQENFKYEYKFSISDIYIKQPTFDDTNMPIFPHDARIHNLTYSVKVIGTIKQIQTITNIITGEITITTIGKVDVGIPIANIPVMVRSKYCNTNIYKNTPHHECEFDPGGYFIVSGSEKVVMSLEKKIENHPFITVRKDANNVIYMAQVDSKNNNVNTNMQILTITMKKEDHIVSKIPCFDEILIIILIKALGLVDDRHIFACIMGNIDNDTMSHIIYNLLYLSHNINVSVMIDNEKVNTNMTIRSQHDAMLYLAQHARIQQTYNESDIRIKKQQQIKYVTTKLNEVVLPHMQGLLIHKAFYICYMMNKLLSCYVGIDQPCDRDSYINKRVDTPGNILEDIFIQNYKKMLYDCNKFFEKKNTNHITPINIINQIKSGLIEHKIKAFLGSGNWNKNNNNKKKGVAQVLQRYTYLNTISIIRRINSPTTDQTTSKMTSPRHLHPTQYGYICPLETPEGQKIGLVKSMALSSTLSVISKRSAELVKNILLNHVHFVNFEDICIDKYNKYIKLFFNGIWMGFVINHIDFLTDIRKKKYSGRIDIMTGIVYDIDNNEIKIYCDDGRVLRPLFRVDDNKLLVTKKQISEIKLNDYDYNKGGIFSWNEFIAKNPGTIEYIDANESYYIMLGANVDQVYEMKRREHFDGIDINPHLISNRYDEKTYCKYTHCEIDPMLLFGSVAVGIPFADHNPCTRGIYQSAQVRQAMSVYSTDFLNRVDISYLLYHPQEPLVTTNAAKYIGIDKLSPGENVICAVACYTGFNQEDAIIMNASAVDRGLFLTTSFKKIMVIAKNNQSSTQTEIITIPDHKNTTCTRYGNYGKLNKDGYIDEEDIVEYNDVLVGKISHINKAIGKDNYKDSSVIYKTITPSVVDRVFPNLSTPEGDPMVKIRLRSERRPIIGDKFCSRAGQKSVCGIMLSQSDMPFTNNGIIPDIIINPCALPSRMTVGQILETVTGKISILNGYTYDGSPFNKVDTDNIKDELKKLNYSDDGAEYMYNGFTGEKIKTKIFIGPTYYQRLKHLVADKIHSRATGPTTILTRQPPEGRSRDGGFRIGEMERDCIISHGMANFLKERLVDLSDEYKVHVCEICGMFAQRMLRRQHSGTDSHFDIYYCKACNNNNKIAKISIPYAFKLLLQELMAINIAPRIRFSNKIG
jgi:DNA-directed RNA polymerase II subunit RPB2